MCCFSFKKVEIDILTSPPYLLGENVMVYYEHINVNNVKCVGGCYLYIIIYLSCNMYTNCKFLMTYVRWIYIIMFYFTTIKGS